MKQRELKTAPKSRASGFTLLEVLVASIIGAFIAISAASSLRSIISSRDKIADRAAAAAQLRFAAETIKKDLINIYRDADIANVKLIGLSNLSDYGPSDNILFHTVNRVKARPDQPEGDVYEVEYGLLFDEQNKSYLIRRLWPNPIDLDPTLGVELPPTGVVTILGENIVMFDILFFYQDQWVEDWPEEMEELPALISVGLALQPVGYSEMLKHNFFINFARWPGGQENTAQIDMGAGAAAPAGGMNNPTGGNLKP